jgi:hypothetical protein
MKKTVIVIMLLWGTVAVFCKESSIHAFFVNVVCEQSCIPLRLISSKRNGRYVAFEYSLSEMYPIAIAIKLGIPKFYASLIAAYNPSDKFKSQHFAFGSGFGSMLPINESFFFNPEITALNTIQYAPRVAISFAPLFGYVINRRFSVSLGPSVSFMWVYKGGILQESFFAIAERAINANNHFVLGARVGVRLRL